MGRPRYISARNLGNFNPPTPCGVGREIAVHTLRTAEFQSTHPVRGGTISSRPFFPQASFQSTHPVRGGTAGLNPILAVNGDFNPPTPCGVGRLHTHHLRRINTISIHPPRAGWDFSSNKRLAASNHFNPPTPCGVGLADVGGLSLDTIISIHPPRAGWDKRFGSSAAIPIYFNPPTPCGVGLIGVRRYGDFKEFQSTHPVRGGTVRG